MNPLVTVIIPVYNAARYIEQTINSVLEQTYKNIEIVVMNDGSTDESESIILNLQKRNSQIRYHYKANSGVSDTRNKGIALAKGDYIAFLDADDVWKPDNLEKKIRVLISTGKKWAFSDLEYIDENSNSMKIERNNFTPFNVVDNLLLWEGDVVPGPCSNIIVSKEQFATVSFDTRLSSPADRDICIQLAVKSEPVYLDEKLWLYRQHSLSMTSTNYKVIDEMLLLYKKADKNNWFSSKRLRRKALSNVYLILAGISFNFPQDKKRVVVFLLKSFYFSPLNVLKKKMTSFIRRKKKFN